MTEPMRAFIAIELPPPLKEALARWQGQLRSASAVKWIDTEAIHLTLKFLGNILPEQVGPLTQAMAQAAGAAAPFEIAPGSLGAFPSARSPRVVWVGMQAPALAPLQQRLEGLLVPLGFPREGRPFSPHLTLGRLRPQATAAESQLLTQHLASFAAGPLPSFTAQALSLMRSTLSPRGAIYSRQASAPLGGSGTTPLLSS